MADEARFMWEAFITAPENAHLLKRYSKSAKEPAPLFDSIGEDLGSSNQEVRNQAFWALVAAMPELTTILHERETREPGWRDRKGKDQHMVNRGMDIVSYLHRKLAVEHRFKIRGEHGKDPRSFINKIIGNWKKDGARKRRREQPLDDEYALVIPDPAGSVEDIALKNRLYEERKREIRDWGLSRSDDEFAILETVYVDHAPLAEVAESNGITSEVNLRKKFSRFRQYAVAERDALLTFILDIGNPFMTGKVRVNLA